MYDTDEYGRAYTTSIGVAMKYAVKDNRVNFHAIKNGYTPQQKYVKLYCKEKTRYYLPQPLGIRINIDYNTNLKRDTELQGLYDYQDEAVSKLVKRYREGERASFLISGEGTGKTMMMLGLTSRLKLKTCIVVTSTTIAKGVYETFRSYYGDAAQQMTSKKLSECDKLPDILIIVRNSFNLVYNQLNGHYGLLLLDEADLLPTRRIDQIMLWKGHYTVGLTATPRRKDFGIEGFQMIFKNMYDTKRQSLPVKVFTYEYRYDYPIEDYMKAQDGLPPESPEVHRRLYINNKDRTKKLLDILGILKVNGYKRLIVFTDRRSHIQEIKEMVPEGIILDGTVKKEDFFKEVENLEEYVIIGNMAVAGRGFDLPGIEAGVLFMSTSWFNTVRQSSGRARRFAGEKDHAVYVDFVDIMSVEGSKPKKLGRYERNKTYKEMGRSVSPFSNLKKS